MLSTGASNFWHKEIILNYYVVNKTLNRKPVLMNKIRARLWYIGDLKGLKQKKKKRHWQNGGMHYSLRSLSLATTIDSNLSLLIQYIIRQLVRCSYSLNSLRDM